jgi:hypothetical protein
MKKNLLIARIAVMIIGILTGVLLLVLGAILKPSTVATIIHWGLIIYGVIIVIGNIPGLVSGIANVHKAAGVFDLVCSVLGIALGAAMIFYQGTVLVALVAAYLIVFPLVRVLMAEQKLEQLKREALRMILGVVLLVFVPFLVGAAFTLVHLLLVVSGWVVIALSTIFGVIEIIRIATAKEIKAPASGHIYVDFEEKQD